MRRTPVLRCGLVCEGSAVSPPLKGEQDMETDLMVDVFADDPSWGHASATDADGLGCTMCGGGRVSHA